MKRPTHKIGKRVLMIAAVIVTLALLMGTAYAAGIFNSIFLGMRGQGAEVESQWIDERFVDSVYETADAYSSRHEETITIPALQDGSVPDEMTPIAGESSITLLQSFYDGQRLMLGYIRNILLKPANFDFGPSHEKFSELNPVEDKINHTHLSLNLEDYLTADEYAQFLRTFEETGSAGVIFYDVYVGDHAYMDDGTDLGYHSEEAETGNGMFLDFYDLPEAARNLQEIIVVLNLKSSVWHYYMDSTGSYYLCEPGNAEQVSFTIPRSEK